MRTTVRGIACIGAIVFLAGAVRAAIPERTLFPPGESPDSLFRAALAHYDAGRTVDARWIFGQLSRRLELESDWQAPAELMFARSLYRLGDTDGAAEAAQRILETPVGVTLPPEIAVRRASYAPYARWILAMTAWRKENLRAVVDQARAIATDPVAPTGLASDARLVAQAAVARSDSSAFLAIGESDDFVRDARLLNRAVGLYHEAQWLAARLTIDALRRSRANTVFLPEIAALESDIRRAEGADLRIGILAPLGGQDSSAGARIVSGVEFALAQQRSPVVRHTVVRDARTQAQAIRATRELAADPSIVAIVGPLTSEHTLVAAAVASCAEVPLISPTASSEGIAAISPYVFQINMTPGAQGRLLAHIAADSLRARTAAILSSADEDDRALAEAFAAEFVRRGGEIVAREWFFANTGDFRPQIGRIRQVGLAREPNAVGPIYAGRTDTSRALIDVSAIDVVLVSAVDPRQLVSIAAQIPAHRIWTRVLGGFAWGYPEVRQQAGEDVEGVVFTTGWDPEATRTRRFSDAWRAARREPADNVAALSYDAASLVLDAIRKGARTRAQVRDALLATDDWLGASGAIALGEDGANSRAYVRTIRGGSVAAVTDWTQLARTSRWGGAGTVPVDKPAGGSNRTSVGTGR